MVREGEEGGDGVWVRERERGEDALEGQRLDGESWGGFFGEGHGEVARPAEALDVYEFVFVYGRG